MNDHAITLDPAHTELISSIASEVHAALATQYTAGHIASGLAPEPSFEAGKSGSSVSAALPHLGDMNITLPSISTAVLEQLVKTALDAGVSMAGTTLTALVASEKVNVQKIVSDNVLNMLIGMAQSLKAGT